MLKIVMIVVWMNHFMACCWYGLVCDAATVRANFGKPSTESYVRAPIGTPTSRCSTDP